MAPVTRWLVLVLGGCAAIALAYVPPRGARPGNGNEFFATQVAARTPARRRAQALAEEWRNVDATLRLLEERQGARRDSDRAGPTIILRGVTLPPNGVRNIETVMESVWRGLGLGETKVRVVLVIDLERPRSSTDSPTPPQDRLGYLVPDSTDRTTCIAYLPAGHYWTLVILGKREARHEGFGRFARWLQAGLGPCAFYAAYGTPGRPVRSWLTARNWDVALYLGAHGIAGERFSSVDLMGNPRFSWYWDAVYRFPPATVACLAGRRSGCRAAVLAGMTEEQAVSVPSVVVVERRWWRAQHLLPGERYLGDVAREVGRDRFQSFWTSSLPVDTALAVALKEPIGDWTERWERRFNERIRLGAAAPLGASLLALLLAASAVGAVALSAARRQVR